MATTFFINHGLSDSLPSVNELRSILMNIIQQVDRKFSHQRNFVVNTTWIDHYADQLKSDYQQFGHIDNLFLIAPLDEMISGIPLPEYVCNIIKIGSIVDDDQSHNHINFSSIIVDKIFKKYTEEELVLSDDPIPYLCYNNKPHRHRQLLVHELTKRSILDRGVVSLGPAETYLYEGLVELSAGDDTVVFHGDYPWCKEDAYTLGDMNIWRNCFLNVVNETGEASKYHMTEKTFKPILGLRPFILNAHPYVTEYLKSKGFYTFDDYWNRWASFDRINPHDIVRRCNAITDIIEGICRLSSVEITDMYQDMLPRLLHNRNRFTIHAREQQQFLDIICT
jgi:hypothetical protein